METPRTIADPPIVRLITVIVTPTRPPGEPQQMPFLDPSLAMWRTVRTLFARALSREPSR